MYRRTFLAAVPTLALAGCLRRLGLTDLVVVTEKRIEAIELDLEDERERTVQIATRRETTDGPAYDTIHEEYAEWIDEDEPLVLEDDLRGILENDFLEVHLRAVVCADAPLADPDAASGCRDVSIVNDDFNDARVGDVLEVRLSDEGIGLLEVDTRRENRE